MADKTTLTCQSGDVHSRLLFNLKLSVADSLRDIFWLVYPGDGFYAMTPSPMGHVPVYMNMYEY